MKVALKKVTANHVGRRGLCAQDELSKNLDQLCGLIRLIQGGVESGAGADALRSVCDIALELVKESEVLAGIVFDEGEDKGRQPVQGGAE